MATPTTTSTDKRLQITVRLEPTLGERVDEMVAARGGPPNVTRSGLCEEAIRAFVETKALDTTGLQEAAGTRLMEDTRTMMEGLRTSLLAEVKEMMRAAGTDLSGGKRGAAGGVSGERNEDFLTAVYFLELEAAVATDAATANGWMQAARKRAKIELGTETGPAPTITVRPEPGGDMAQAVTSNQGEAVSRGKVTGWRFGRGGSART